jgi:hypothetical protein
MNHPGLSHGMLLTLGEKNIKTLADFADLSVDEISKQYEQKKAELDTQIERLSDTQDNKALNSKILLLKEDVEFLRRSLTIIKDIKG